MTEFIALFLVGLSLFFHGIAGVRTNLQSLTSRRLRQQLSRWAKHPVFAGLWGFLFGAITQSSTAVAFILTSLVSAGLITVANALPIVAWANLGTVALVMFVSFDVNLAFLYVLGIAGVALAFNLGSARFRPVITALFCVGLLFFGLHQMKEAFAPLPGFAWFRDFTGFIQGSGLAAFCAGALLRVLLQSSSGLAVIAIAFAHGGLLSPDQASMLMYGTGVGVGLSVVLLASNLRGVARQIALYQALINSLSGLTLGTLYYVETLTGTPLALHLTHVFADSESLRLACSFLFLQSTTVVIALVGSRFAAPWLEKLSPITEEQDLSRPRYISGQALGDAESALDLAEKEQLRLFEQLPAQLDTVRAETAATARVPAGVLHQAAATVGTEVQGFLHELMDQPADRTTSARLLVLDQRQTTLAALNDTLYAFTATFDKLRACAAPSHPFLENLGESLNTLLLTALDALRSCDAVDREMLLGLTADRGDLMERLRRNLSGDTASTDQTQKAQLFYLTSLFERAVWLLRQLGQSLAAPR